MEEINLQEIAEIELFILKRMKEYTLGDHASVFKGSGFNFVGIRDWQPGDRLSNIDWAQSSLNNFSPLITREFEQDSNAAIVAVADASLSTRCGMEGDLIATAIARAVAAAGLSAMFFQDRFGVVTFNDRFEQVAAARPRIGRSHLLVLSRPVSPVGARQDRDRASATSSSAIESQVRKAALVPVISDFLFPDVEHILARAVAAECRARRVPADGGRALRVRRAQRCRTAGSTSSTSKAAGPVCCRGGRCGRLADARQRVAG